MFSSFLETAAAAVLCRLIGSYQDDDNRHIPLPRAWSLGIQKLPRHRPRRKNLKNPPIDWAFDHQRSVPPLFLTYNKSLSHILGFILTTQLEDRVTDELPVLYHPPHTNPTPPTLHAPLIFMNFLFLFSRNSEIIRYLIIQFNCCVLQKKKNNLRIFFFIISFPSVRDARTTRVIFYGASTEKKKGGGIRHPQNPQEHNFFQRKTTTRIKNFLLKKKEEDVYCWMILAAWL